MTNLTRFCAVLLILMGLAEVAVASSKTIYYGMSGTDTGGSSVANPRAVGKLIATGDLNMDTLYVKFVEPAASGTFSQTWALPAISTNKVVILMPAVEGDRVQLAPTQPNSNFSILNIPNPGTTYRGRYTVILRDIVIANQSSTKGANTDGTTSLFRIGNNCTLTLDNDSINGISSHRMPLVKLGSSSTFNIVNSQILNVQVLDTYPIIEADNTSIVNIKHSLISEWSAPGSHLMIITGTPITIVGSTFTGCTVGNGKNLINVAWANLNNAYARIVNNTFSGNTGMDNAIYAGVSLTSGYTNIQANAFVVNNTLYNSGDIGISNSARSSRITYSIAATILNNLLFGTSATITTGDTDETIARNIFGDRFYDVGTTTGVALTDGHTTDYFVDDTLTLDTLGTPGYHAVKAGALAVLKQGGTVAAVSDADCRDLLVNDQRGAARPPMISVGSYDRIEFELETKFFTIAYDPDRGLTVGETFDLTDALKRNGVIPDSLTVKELCPMYADSIQPDAGEAHIAFNADSSAILMDFIPAARMVNGLRAPQIGTVGTPLYFVYRLKYGNIIKTGLAIVSIINIGVPSGIFSEENLRCYTPMGTVNFEPEEKFEWFAANGYTVGNSSYNLDGFSIPLVGDLNGDGLPEIVALGLQDLSYNPVVAKFIYIINGQTGKTLQKFELPMPFTMRVIAHYQSSPSQMVLANVDATNDGHAEIIMAFGYNDNATYNRQLVCFDVNPQTFALTQRWVSTVPYDASTNGAGPADWNQKATPLPQIADFNLDGVPDVLVYNKIYNARTGELEVTLEELEPNGSWKNYNYPANYREYAYIGRNRRALFYDQEQNYSALYDIDGDGTLDVIAGGKVYYNIGKPDPPHYDVKSADAGDSPLNIGDGFTAVADVDGDHLPDVVVATIESMGWANDIDSDTEFERWGPYGLGSTNTGSVSGAVMRIRVWDPGLCEIVNDTLRGVADKASRTPVLKANVEVPFSTLFQQGNHSPIYIGDIDGQVQTVTVDGKTKRIKVPEISILGGRFYNTSGSTSNSYGQNKNADIPFHPNVFAASEAQRIAMGGHFEYRNDGAGYNINTSTRGVLMSWTWDATEPDSSKRLKVSFVMEHQDNSINTGFTLFDFDNDGIQEIVYRDRFTLRVISARPDHPFVSYDDYQKYVNQNDRTIFRLSRPISSITGFEYPTVADLDGDASADIIVTGTRTGGNNNQNTTLYAFTAKSGADHWAPAPAEWNQFHHTPLKINEDITIPMKNLHPLSPKLAFKKPSDEANDTRTYLYNSNIMQVVESSVDNNGRLVPIFPIPDLRIVSTRIDLTTSPNTTAYIRLIIRNYGDAAANKNVAIKYYRGDDNYVPSGLTDSTTLGVDLFPYSTVKNPQQVEIVFAIPWAERLMNHTIRVADPTSKKNGVVTDRWLDESYWADCNWSDNVVELGTFVARDDAYTVVQGETQTLDFLLNDSLNTCSFTPLSGNIGQSLKMWYFDAVGDSIPINTSAYNAPATYDIGSFTFTASELRYTAPMVFPDGIVELHYNLTCRLPSTSKTITASAKIRIFVVQSCTGHFFARFGQPYRVCLNDYPSSTSFKYYDTETAPYVSTTLPDIANPSENTFWVQPRAAQPYYNVIFPRAKIKVTAVGTHELYIVPNIWE